LNIQSLVVALLQLEQASHSWSHAFSSQQQPQLHFNIDTTKLHTFMSCDARFLSVDEVVHDGDILVAEVMLTRQRAMPSLRSARITKCSLQLEENTGQGRNQAVNLQTAPSDGASQFLGGLKTRAKIRFVLRPTLSGPMQREALLTVWTGVRQCVKWLINFPDFRYAR